MSGHEHVDKTHVEQPRPGIGPLGKRFVIEVIVLNVFLGWFLLWSRLTQLHISRGDTVKAAVTAVLFIPPAMWMLVRHVTGRFGWELPTFWTLITPSR